MNPWPFVIGAYAIALVATAALTAAELAGDARAEAEAERIGRDS